MLKKCLSILLSFILLVGCIGVIPAFSAAEGDAEIVEELGNITGDCTWSLDGTVLTITGSGDMGEYSYSSKAPWGNEITEVIIGDGVTSIGACTFYGCSELASVTIPDTVLSIGYRAFSGCAALGSVVIPESVTAIGDEAFRGCESMTSAIILEAVTAIGWDAFDGCASLVIYGAEDSYASLYAADNSLVFKPILGVCPDCGAYLHEDNLVVDEAVPATCTEDGLTEGAHCPVCGYIVTAQETVPCGHTPVDDIGYPATCTEDGLTDGSHCSVCGEIIVAQEVIPKTGHKPIIDKAVDATCQHEGHTIGAYCEYCGEVYVQSEIIPKVDHTPVVDEAVEPDCTHTGLTAGTHCSVCGEVLVPQEIVPTTEHIPGETVIENVLGATCTTDGSYDEVVYCVDCGAEISRVTVKTDPALGHSYKIVPGKEATYFHTGLEDGVQCERCGMWLIEQAETPVCEGEGLFGDVDGDDVITAVDAAYIQRYLADIPIPFEIDVKISDADEDGMLTVLDSLAIQRWLVGDVSAYNIGKRIGAPAEEPTEPETAEPDPTEPETTEPEVTEPEVTDPEVTDPVVNEPEVTDPAVTDPDIPETPDPVVTDADISTPATTET